MRSSHWILVVLTLRVQADDSAVGLLSQHPVWISKVVWKDIGDDVDHKAGACSVAQFRAGGEFRRAEAHLTRWRGKVGVSIGDGFSRYVGRWRVVDGQISIDYRLESPTRQVARPIVIGEWRREVARIRGQKPDGQIILGKMPLKPNTILDEADLQFLLGP